jgi:alpha-glucoside transport system substrate-binding protein
MKRKKSFLILLSVSMAASLVLVACGGGRQTEVPTVAPFATFIVEEPTEEPTEEAPLEEGASRFETPFPVMPGGFLEKALAGEYTGTTVTVGGFFEGTDPDGVKMRRSVKQFEELTGIDVDYVGSKEFDETISARVGANEAPDIVDFPQPGKAASFVQEGLVVDVTRWMSETWLNQQYNQSWRDMAMVDGVEAGVFQRFKAKSLVWYPKDDWEAAGYEIPTTWDALIALMDRIVAAGDTPWCVGIESGSATGWVATDWLEDMMLRTTSLDNYDKWTTGELPFSSPEVKNAAEIMEGIWFNDDYIYGGTANIVETFFGDSPVPMFEDPPRCWLHKQDALITGYFPRDTEIGVDYDFFYLPPIGEAFGKPLLVTGDIMVMFDDRPEVRALMEYFTTPQSVSGWLEAGGALAVHQTATPDMYSVELEREIASLVAQVTDFRMDGSQQMPSVVGSGAFERYMTYWVVGSIDLDTALAEIDAAWPR